MLVSQLYCELHEGKDGALSLHHCILNIYKRYVEEEHLGLVIPEL